RSSRRLAGAHGRRHGRRGRDGTRSACRGPRRGPGRLARAVPHRPGRGGRPRRSAARARGRRARGGRSGHRAPRGGRDPRSRGRTRARGPRRGVGGDRPRAGGGEVHDPSGQDRGGVKVALLSDIHANLVALEAVLAAMGPVDALWVTGDPVGYGPDPSDVLALLGERRATLVAGNPDRAVATGQGLELFNPIAAAAVLV